MQILKARPLWQQGCVIFFGLAMLAFALIALTSAAPNLYLGGNWPSLACMLPIMLAFAAAGLYLIVAGALPIIARVRLSAPTVSVSSSRLQVGERFSVAYEQAFKSATQTQGCSVQLILREWARSGSGKNSSTYVHNSTVADFETPGRRYEAGETLRLQHDMRIPPDGMHSFETHSNRITWLLRIRVCMAGWPDWVQELDVTVVPERAA